MAIILTIIESSEQIIFGIPTSLIVEADQPSSIFYTLDGTDPDIASNIYTNILILPTNDISLTVKFFATNTLDQSEIVTRIYAPDVTALRQPRDVIEGNFPDQSVRYNSFPYSSYSPNLPINYLGPSTLGIVDDPNVPNVPDGYDGQGNQLFNIDRSPQDYPLIYSETDSAGRRGTGIGNLPHKVSVIPQQEGPNKTVNLFDPRANVIIIDNTQPMPEGFKWICRENFSMQNVERFSDGNLLYTTGEEGNRPSATFLRAHWNPKNSTIRYYYRDARSNKWLIAIEPYSKKVPINESIIQNLVGNPKIFKWIPFFWRASPH